MVRASDPSGLCGLGGGACGVKNGTSAAAAGWGGMPAAVKEGEGQNRRARPPRTSPTMPRLSGCNSQGTIWPYVNPDVEPRLSMLKEIVASISVGC